MFSCKLSSVAVLLVAGLASAAPFLEDVGRKLHDFGQKAIPAVRGVCGFVNAYQGYPAQGYPQGYPQVYPQGYPVVYPQRHPQGYPQFPSYYPQYPSNFPQNPNSYIPALAPPGSSKNPSDGASEQDDLNKSGFSNGINNPPPQINDIFKNFDKLPKVDFSEIDDEENQVLERRPKFHQD